MFLQTHRPHLLNGKRMPAIVTLNGYMAKNSRNRTTRGAKDYTKHLASNKGAEVTQTKDTTPLPKEEMPWTSTPCADQNYLTNRRQN